MERSFTARYARELVQHNGFSDVIEVIEDFVEDVNLPEKVDVIISEWMGTALLVRQGEIYKLKKKPVLLSVAYIFDLCCICIMKGGCS